MNKILIGTLLAAFAANANALTVYKRGTDQSYVANCTNATTREDGTPLTLAEIASVEYYIDDVDGNVTNPLVTVTMTGGCKATTVNLQTLPAGIVLYKFAKTVDTAGLKSTNPSTPGVDFIITNANPNAPGQIK